MVCKEPKSKYWWYKFTWKHQLIRESTKRTNRRVGEQMEAARRTALAKGELGIRDRKPVLTLKDFAEQDFLPFVQSTFAAKPKTLAYYACSERLDSITSDRISEYVAKRQKDKGKHGNRLQAATLNRELEVLRRMFHLAQQWGRVDRALPNVKMLPGEKHRERVLSAAEEDLYFRGAATCAMEQFADAILLRR